jgi:hypothetical protein
MSILACVVQFAIAYHFVGLSITRDRLKKTLYMSQPDDIKRILKRFNMFDCDPKILPAEPGNRSKRIDEVCKVKMS